MNYSKTFQFRGAWPKLRWIAPIAACVMLVGCTSVNPDPFVKYRNAVQEAQSGIDAAMSVSYDWTRAGFIEGFSSNPDSKFTQLMIQPGAGYDWSLPSPPIYLSVKQTRSGLAELNEAFTKYANLLVKLSGGELVSVANFEQLAKELNQNTTDAANALHIDASSNGIALFSTVASESARLYIENQREEHLKHAIEENQTNVAVYSALCVELIHTIRGNIKTYYAERTEPIKNAWNSTVGEKRQKNTEVMLNLNEQYADAMRILQELEVAYKSLPEAHFNLAKAIETPEFDVNGIKTLYASARRLQHLHDDLIKNAEKETKTEKP